MLLKVARKRFIFGPSSINHFPYKINFSLDLSPDLPSLLVYAVDYCFFSTPSTDLLGGRTFLLVLKKLHFWYLNIFPDFDLFFCADSV